MPVSLTCVNCGNGFSVKPKDAHRKYCSHPCYRAYEIANGRQHMVVAAVEFSCANCGKPFGIKPGHLRSYRTKFNKDPLYCSRKCGGEGRRRTEGNPCIVCGKPVTMIWNGNRTSNHRNTLCSPDVSNCRKIHKLAEHERLRPSETREIQRNITSQGYVRLRFPNQHGVKGREVLEHRLVFEKELGRELTPDEVVHHLNGQRDQNDRSNLELWSKAQPPGQRVADKITFAIDMLRLYPEYAKAAGVMLVDAPHVTPLVPLAR